MRKRSEAKTRLTRRVIVLSLVLFLVQGCHWQVLQFQGSGWHQGAGSHPRCCTEWGSTQAQMVMAEMSVLCIAASCAPPVAEDLELAAIRQMSCNGATLLCCIGVQKL